MKEKLERYKALREGGYVKRCHTFPTHGEYTVGKHSFDALNLILVLHPNPSIELIKAIAWHDVPERWTGDLPATIKWSYPVLKDMLTSVEASIEKRFDINIELTDLEKAWLSAVDRIELWIWAREQLAMGNSYAQDMVERLQLWFLDNHATIPVECNDFYRSYTTKRLGDDV